MLDKEEDTLFGLRMPSRLIEWAVAAVAEQVFEVGLPVELVAQLIDKLQVVEVQQEGKLLKSVATRGAEKAELHEELQAFRRRGRSHEEGLDVEEIAGSKAIGAKQEMPEDSRRVALERFLKDLMDGDVLVQIGKEKKILQSIQANGVDDNISDDVETQTLKAAPRKNPWIGREDGVGSERPVRLCDVLNRQGCLDEFQVAVLEDGRYNIVAAYLFSLALREQLSNALSVASQSCTDGEIA